MTSVELSSSLRASLAQYGMSPELFAWCGPAEVPEPENRLLVHGGDMTTTLEEFYRERIALRVLASGRNDGRYFREVILEGAESGKPYEFGLIEFELEGFPGPLREAIVAERTPLGTLMTQSGFEFRSRPGGFFSVARDALPPKLSALGSAEAFYGRYNRLATESGICLARIIEILPRDANEDEHGRA